MLFCDVVNAKFFHLIFWALLATRATSGKGSEKPRCCTILSMKKNCSRARGAIPYCTAKRFQIAHSGVETKKVRSQFIRLIALLDLLAAAEEIKQSRWHHQIAVLLAFFLDASLLQLHVHLRCSFDPAAPVRVGCPQTRRSCE